MTANGKTIAGCGASRRRVMPLTAMKNACKFSYLVENGKNRSGRIKLWSRLVSLDGFSTDPNDSILVLIFGHIDEISREVGAQGYDPGQFDPSFDVLAHHF